MSESYQKLHPKVQKWIFQQGWPELREIQNKAIEPILAGNKDVIISASTAAGKTEAFFLPACSAIAEKSQGFGILYISPLKALINDQFRRLESLCDILGMDVTPWHGDSTQSKKNKAKKAPSGILLITPESLESLLIREPGWVIEAFSSLKYIVVDEFHAFIGSERGHHLLSLLNRLEHLLSRHNSPIPRVALSATLGNIEQVPLLLRPTQTLPCEIITTSSSLASLKIQVRGYIDPESISADENELTTADDQICQDLFEICRGDSHLVFANSRQRTELIAAQLSDLCEQNHVPNEFYPHHGSLAKELRESLETRLQKEQLPTTAICTMTLELGIDIGKVNSVAQVTAPHSVSSLRQRLGRSGRRGNASILRMFIAEKALTERSNPIDNLRLELVQSAAMIRLLIVSKWFEPADTSQFHFSTLLHQILAITAQWGGIRPDQLYGLLCKTGPFDKVSIEQFKLLLTHMASTQLLTQLQSGEIVLGLNGERIVSHYTFYAVFKTPEEFRMVVGSKTLGTLPIDSVVIPDQHIVFGGRRWKVLEIDTEKKVIYLEPTKGGRPPKFGGHGMGVHDVIRQEMFEILRSGEHRIAVEDSYIEFLDETARSLMADATRYFKDAQLESKHLIQYGKNVIFLPWMGDKIVNTLAVLLKNKGYILGAFAGVIEIENTEVSDIQRVLSQLLLEPLPTNEELAESVPVKYVDKYDEFLPNKLLNLGYGSRAFDSASTFKWLKVI